MANDARVQSLSSILSNMKLDAAGEDPNRVGKISILKRPTVPPSSDSAADEAATAHSGDDDAASSSAEETQTSAKQSTTTTSDSPSSSTASDATTVTTSVVSASGETTSPVAAAATSSGDPKSAIDPESHQNRRRKEMLRAEMNWRNKCEQIGGDFSVNSDWGLMEAEWLRSIPEDFENKWLVIPCPVGKRCSLWALDGETHAYTKQGFFLESFESALPNGFHYSGCHGSTFLDGVYCENLSTYFVLDALQWDNYDLRRGSSEFRLFHLNSKMAEHLASGDVHPRIRSRFKNFVMQLPMFPCTPSGVMKALAWSPLPNLQLELDGILFYHHDAMYTSGATPLVAWIKPWMADEVFSNVKIPPHLLSRKPNHYRNRQTFMKEWDDKEARKRAKGTEKVGRKAFHRGPLRLSTAYSSGKTSANRTTDGAAAAANNDDDDDDDDEDDEEANPALPPLNDDPALAVAAKVAEKSENSLLALVGENILDTFGASSPLLSPEEDCGTTTATTDEAATSQ